MNLNNRLSTAIFNSDLAEVKHCLASGARVDEVILLQAIWTNHADIMRVVLKHSARFIKDYGGALLHFALYAEKLQVARFLIENGADIGFTMWFGATKGHLENVKFLVKHSKSRKIKPHIDYCLVVASCCGHLAVVEFLLKSGANPNATDKNGKTALSWAKTNAIRQTLIRAGARK